MHPVYSERDAARAIAQISRVLPPGRRVMTGQVANSLALESDIFSFYIRNEPLTGALQNLDGWERFRPTMATTHLRASRTFDPASHGLAPLCQIPLYSDVPSAIPITITLWFTTLVQPRPVCPPPTRPAE